MKRNITEFLEQDKWMDIREPDGLQERIMNNIDRQIYRRMRTLNIFRYATVSVFAVCLTLAAVLLVNVLKPTRVVIVYPNAPNIDSVEIIGNFDRKKQTIQMELDPKEGVWRAEILSRSKYVDDYSIQVYEVEEEPDDTAI